MIVSRTPLRVSLLGGGSDYAQHFMEYGGQVLGGAINHYVYVCMHNHNITHFFDLPNKSGLASSSAYTVGLMRICSDMDNVTIGKLATLIELEKTNNQVGYQDQYLCAVGGFHQLKFSEHGIRDILICEDECSGLQEHLMLFDTHQYRKNGSVIPKQLERVKDNTEALNKMAGMVDEGVGMLKTQDFIAFGQLLDESWKLKKSLAESVSTPQVNDIYTRAIEAGAVGGKLLGAGGGGFIVFVVAPEKQEGVKKALSGLTHVSFKFESEGSKVIYRD